ncbi:hypothetical protein ACFL6W_05585 [Thermodesulfobacteriota bacterium]
MERYESYWKNVKGSESLELFGFDGSPEPEPVNVNLDLLIDLFKTGYSQFSSLWKEILSEASFKQISNTVKMDSKEFRLPTDAWVKILYELASTYHLWSINRNKLLDMMTPLYFGRVASFVNQSRDMSSLDAEALVEEQAVKFEEQKEYLIKGLD